MTTRKYLPFRPTAETAAILSGAADRLGLSQSNVLEALVRLHARRLRPGKSLAAALPPRAGAGRKNSGKNPPTALDR